MNKTQLWIEGARLRTLPAAIAPVAAGTGAAAALNGFHAGRALLALGVALALQVGVNYANDYSDGVRGTDDTRVGPVRIVASGQVAPRTVKIAAFACFGVAGLLGLTLVLLTQQWWLLGAGLLAILAAWGYTGGKNPYGYRGLGEVGVFVFFGLFAVLGTTYTQAGRISWAAASAAIAIGLLACAILMANNLRDIATDIEAGKRTLAVRVGDQWARTLCVWWVVGGVLFALLPSITHHWVGLLALTAIPAAFINANVRTARGPELIAVLRNIGLLELAIGLGLGVTLAL